MSPVCFPIWDILMLNCGRVSSYNINHIQVLADAKAAKLHGPHLLQLPACRYEASESLYCFHNCVQEVCFPAAADLLEFHALMAPI